jgi:hypothetical protein
MFIRTVAPAIEPITLSYVKLHSRIDDASQDPILALMISTARAYCENLIGRSLITQKWRLVMDRFPGPQLLGSALEQRFGYPGTHGYPSINLSQPILLQWGPFQSVDAIKYLDMNGVQTTVAPTDYVSDLTGLVGRITPPFSKIWPIVLPQIGAVTVDFTTGYGDTADSVPAGIRQWMLMRVATMYENREEVAMLARGKIQELPYVDCLLDPYRVKMI